MNIQRVKYKDIEEIPKLQINKKFKGDFFGSSPAPFIGRYGYPNINIGVLSPQFSGDTSYYDSPKLWSKGNFGIGQIASMRYGLVNSRMQWNIKEVHKQNRFMNICQEVGMAKRSAELEINLQHKPQLQLKPEREIIPFGPQGQIKQARITANTKVDTRIERVVSDTDLKSSLALISLYQKGFQESFLNKVLSTANLGIKKDRKLVPTRWSVTAVDDTVGKQLITDVKNLPVGDYQVHFGGGWGNYYLVLMFPEVWSYELFETYLNKKVNPWSKNSYAYSTDHELFPGRKTYAEETAGGYYAARLPILEKMKSNKRQNSTLVLRFITPEYNVPLGVWVCREATRKSLSEKPISFASKELMIKYATELVSKKLGFNLQLLLRKSKLLQEMGCQKKLREF